MKLYFITNLMILILFRMLLLSSISLVKVQMVWLIENRESHSFVDRGSICILMQSSSTSDSGSIYSSLFLTTEEDGGLLIIAKFSRRTSVRARIVVLVWRTGNGNDATYALHADTAGRQHTTCSSFLEEQMAAAASSTLSVLRPK
jgi:hypothetical protein